MAQAALYTQDVCIWSIRYAHLAGGANPHLPCRQRTAAEINVPVILLASVDGERHLKTRAPNAGQPDPPPDALPSPDNHDLLQLLQHLDDIATAIEHDLQQRFDSSLTEFEILEALRQKPLPQSHLCRRNNRSAPVVSRCVKRLTDQGFTASHPPRHDRRERVASLLKRGVNQHQRIRAHLAGMLFQLAQELGPAPEARLFQLSQRFTRGAHRAGALNIDRSSEQ